MAVFEAARAEADDDVRERLLQDLCDGDELLLREVRELLGQELEPDFLDPVEGMTGGQEERGGPLPKLGEFELLQRIDSGSCGVVWRARQPSLERDVALKVMTAGPGTPTGLVDRFHREPMLAAALNHPHIVPVYAEGQRDDTHWFAMQLVEGHSLAEELHRQEQVGNRPNAKAPLLPGFESGQWFAAVAKICADTADALQAAHERGIVHRDIKPQNLLLDPRGHVLVADFGIARDQSLGALTDPGVIAGTLHYMSPEQARIETTAVDHRTDVYSLGVVLYEMLTLARPFEGGTSAEIYHSIRHQSVRPVRQRNARVPRDLETICEAAMERVADARYRSAAELRDDLRRFLNHSAIERQPPSRWARLTASVRRKQRALVVAASMFVVAVLGFYLNHAMAADSERRTLEHECQVVLQGEDLDDLDVATLSALRQRCVDAEWSSQILEATKTRLNAYRKGLVRQIREQFSAGQGEPLREREKAVMRGILLAHRAGQVFPDDPEVARAMPVDPMTSRIDVQVVDRNGAELAATLEVRAITATTGMPAAAVALGSAPVQALALAPGLYRFAVTAANGEPQSFLREVEPMARTALLLRYQPQMRTVAGMVKLGGDLHLPAHAPPHGLAGKKVRIEPFWLDRTEVTVGQYARFLADTGHRAPAGWELFDREACRNKPVVGVTFGDAVAYAEWCGKRLPTYAEWALAAHGSGPSPRLFPWLGTDVHGNCQHEVDFDLTLESRMAAYERHAVAVDADPLSATPEGVLEMFGNVAEWTASPGVDLGEDGFRLLARLDHRIVAGHEWFVLSYNPDATLLHTRFGPVGSSHASFQRGFRCARSASR